MIWIDYILMIVGLGIIVIVLLQQSDDDIKDAFTGSSSELFKNRKARGFELFLNRLMIGLSVAFVILSIFANNAFMDQFRWNF